jgi:pectate lyase
VTRRHKKAIAIILGAMMLFSAAPAFGKQPDQVGQEVLGARDGWAAYSTGTSGGAAAKEDQIYTVTNRQELIQALGGDNATNRNNIKPKIIYIQGTIDINTDESGRPLGIEEYRDPAYNLQAYLTAYAPETWGRKKLTGPLEEARLRSAAKQKAYININIGSNTTLIGLGDDARIVGGAFQVKGVDNVIIRNLTFEAPIDFFPGWDPLDGAEGNWNAEYDGLTVDGSTHVWITQNTFGDGEHTDKASGTYFGRKYMQHDGLLDIKNGSDYVTVSYNVLQDHDKVSLVGSSDTSKVDDGRLKITFHHNYYKNLSQRLPRIRFGQVHMYNNYYEFNQASDYDFSYAWGVGVNSKGYAENNYFEFDYEADVSKIIDDFKGTTIYEEGTYVSLPSGLQRDVDLVAAFNAANTVQLNENVGWTPQLHEKIDPTPSVPALVKAKAGAGKLHLK